MKKWMELDEKGRRKQMETMDEKQVNSENQKEENVKPNKKFYCCA